MDYAAPIRKALIAGQPAPQLSLEAKRFVQIRRLGDRYILAGGTPDWSKPQILPAWLASRPGAVERTAGL